MEGSFEYGKDIAVLYGALRSAERILEKKHASSAADLLLEDACQTYSETVSRGVQNAYKGTSTRDVVDQRMHCALFCNVLITTGMLKKEELGYFESILDNVPKFSFRTYLAITERCGWTGHFVESLQALPGGIRLTFVEKTYMYAEESLFLCSCLVSVLAWSLYIERNQVLPQCKEGILVALSSLECREDARTIRSSFCRLLATCAKCFSTPSSRSALSPFTSQIITRICGIISDFLKSFLLPSTYSLECANVWQSDVNLRRECPEDIYSAQIFWYECTLCAEELLSVLKSSQVGFLDTLIDVLRSAEVQRTLVKEREKCDGYVNVLLNKPGQTTRTLFYALEVVCLRVNAVLRFVPSDDALTGIKWLKDMAEKNKIEGHAIDIDGIIDNVIECLESDPATCAATICEVLIWIMKENTLIKNGRVLESLDNHLCLLSHPVVFPYLVCKAQQLKDSEPLKELVIKTCSAASPALQTAMLRYCLTQHGCSDTLKTENFEEDLVERINMICNAPQETEVSAGIVGLCLQDPSRVIRELVRLAVGDGCVEAVCEVLRFIRPACEHQKSAGEPSLLEHEMERSFNAQLLEPSKSDVNFVSLIKQLAQYHILECDTFLHHIVYYLEMGGCRNKFPEECFPMKVFAVMCRGISERYKYPMLLMMVQVLDRACLLLNGKRKEEIINILESCVDDLLDATENTSDGLQYLTCMLQRLSNMCQVALCSVLRKTKLEGHPLYKCLSNALSDDLLLQTKQQWETTCTQLRNQHKNFTAVQTTLPYFCLGFSGATWDEWEILFERLVDTLRVAKDDVPTVPEAVRTLTNCVVVCARFFRIGSWGYFFSCFAKLVKARLQSSKIMDNEVCDIIRELLFSLSFIPTECHRQGILFLLDVAQLLNSPARDKMTTTIRETFALTESLEESVVTVDRINDNLLRKLLRTFP